MRVLIDTSAYSMLMRGADAVASFLNDADEVYLSAVVVGELLAGFKKGTVEERNIGILAAFVKSTGTVVLPVDEETATRYAAILEYLRRAGTPLPTNDLWIAASAMQHGLRLVTCDRHFLRLPQVVTQLFQ